MEKRLNQLKLDEKLNEETKDDETVKIEQQCVSRSMFLDHLNSLFEIKLSGKLHNRTERFVCKDWRSPQKTWSTWFHLWQNQLWNPPGTSHYSIRNHLREKGHRRTFATSWPFRSSDTNSTFCRSAHPKLLNEGSRRRFRSGQWVGVRILRGLWRMNGFMSVNPFTPISSCWCIKITWCQKFRFLQVLLINLFSFANCLLKVKITVFR